MGAYYPTDYYTLPRSRQELAQWAVHEKFKAELLVKFIDRGSLIEIGPSNGAFALLAQELGFDVTAIEVDLRCAEFIQNVLNIRAIHTVDEVQALASAGPADAIAMWQVLEHLSRPADVLRTAAQVLRPGGILIVATPNPMALQFRLLGKAWTHLDAPRHVVLMPRTAVETISRRAGLEPIYFTVTDAGSISWNDFGWKYSLTPFFRHHRAKRLAGLFARLVGVCAAPLERVASLATSYTIVFRRAT
jgi:2-polyprenyl-3-methyl-5-hydroxy-6-metoxy-1,4-benzoquinol methylase